MRIFKNKPFARFARKSGITDGALRAAVDEVVSGLVHADLGGGVFKQRVARAGGGKSGGFRTIILFRRGHRAVFVHGFAKNEIDNINDADLAVLKLLAESILRYNDKEIATALAAGVLIEVATDGKTIPQPDNGRDPRNSGRIA